MEIVIIVSVLMLLSVLGGGYLGYRYGRKVEVRAQADAKLALDTFRKL